MVCDMVHSCVYILKSVKSDRYYIGFSQDLERRLGEHNSGKVRATKYSRPWQLVYSEEHADATSARQREQQLKRMKSRVYLDALMAERGSG